MSTDLKLTLIMVGVIILTILQVYRWMIEARERDTKP